jgi:ABC-2 type transport system ATP-binding protein
VTEAPSAVTTEAAIQTTGLSKVFGRQRAVDALDLTVPRGSIFGFLGPNGSGKTTTIRMLLGLASASSGEIRMLGEPMPQALASVLPRVGALVEGPAIYPFLSGRANLLRLDAADRHAPASTRRARVDAALERVGLAQAADKKAHAYSLGMKQRLGIANALVRPRELLILDEPSNGLDPQGTREVRHLIRSLADDGTTVFVSSHLLSEIEQLCSHVAVMSAGTLVAQGTLDELRRGSARLTVKSPDTAAAVAVLEKLHLVIDGPGPDERRPDEQGPDGVISATLIDGVLPETVTAALVAAGVRVRGITVAGETLEDRFVALTGEGFDVAG